MDRKVIVMSFGILISGFILDGVECSIFSREEKQKYSAITTAKTLYGETYDCFDIDKQPSLLHPALIGHQVKISPGKKYVDVLTNNSFKHEDRDKNVWLEEGCPFGTVPIPRTTRKHFGRDKNIYTKALNHSIKYDGGGQFAGIIVSDGGGGYYGVTAYSSVHHPTIASDSHQWSASSIIIDNGGNQIQAGWIVHPDLYHDTNTRFYTLWTKDDQRSTGCYNIDCPGFVVVNGNFPLNFVFEQVSDPKGTHVEVKILIRQDIGHGDWWLFVNDIGVGYWPGALFTSLGQSATYIRLGGLIYSPNDNLPPMGSGKYKGDNKDRTAYMYKVELVLKDSYAIPPPTDLYQKVRYRCYFVGSDYYSSDTFEGFNFLYGGKGGISDITCV